MVGLTSFTCVFYIHGATSFWGLPVPPGGRRLPLQELVFSRPLTLALVPLVLQGLLPRHNQNPLVKGTVLRRDPRPGMVSIWSLVPAGCLHHGDVDKEACLGSREARLTSHRKMEVIYSRDPQ